MTRVGWLLILCFGCRKDQGEESGPESAAETPSSCVAGRAADTEVCAIFDASWTQEDADEVCLDLGGAEGECPDDELGRCVFDDGLEYVLYGMSPAEAEDYCEYLRGEWLEPGEELTEG